MMSAWPEIITTEFWSFTFKHAIRLHNMKLIPSKNNRCPYKLFTGETPPHHISDFQVFGCPAYVLEKNLADNNGIPKWKACSYQGVYVSHSDVHASNVVLVWNPLTKLVLPQYHVIFDEEFTTVLSDKPLNLEDIDLMLVNLLCSSKWWHQDHLAETTKDENTQHYYFDSNWTAPECPQHSQKRVRFDDNF